MSIYSSISTPVIPNTISSATVSADGSILVHIYSNSSGFAAGVCASACGPFSAETIAVASGSSTIYWMSGTPSSTGGISAFNTDSHEKSTSLFSILEEVYTVRDTHSDEIYNKVSSFFDLFEDRDYLLRYWNTWQMMSDDALSIVTDADRNDNILEMRAFNSRRHVILGLDYRNATVVSGDFPYEFELDLPISSIPKMWNMVIKSNRTVLVQDVDYEISSGAIRLAVLPARNGEVLYYYCPTVVLVDDERPQKNFGSMLGLVDSSSESYLAALRALWYAYWNGPSSENIANAISVACGIPVSQSQSVVMSVTSTQMTLSNGQSITIPSGVYPVVQEGELVPPFKALLDGVSVYDRMSSDRHLDLVSIGTLLRLFNRPTVYDYITGLYGEDVAKEWTKTMLQWHVHVIDVDLNKVFQMDKFYGQVLASLISEFRPKQDFGIAIFRGTIGDDIISITDGTSGIGTWDMRYTVKRNPGEDFDSGNWYDKDEWNASADIEDPSLYGGSGSNFHWAELDAQVMNMDEQLLVYGVSASTASSGVSFVFAINTSGDAGGVYIDNGTGSATVTGSAPDTSSGDSYFDVATVGSVIYATYGNYAYPGSAAQWSKLFKTPDYGTTWEDITPTSAYLDQYAGMGTKTLDVSNDGQTILTIGGPAGGTGTTYHVPWVSTDGGSAWYYAASGYEALGDVLIGVAIAPSSASVMYIADNPEGVSAIWRSTDSGSGWTLASSGLISGYDRFQPVIDPSNPDYVYLCSNRDSNSMDGAATWYSMGFATQMASEWGAGAATGMSCLVAVSADTTLLFAGRYAAVGEHSLYLSVSGASSSVGDWVPLGLSGQCVDQIAIVPGATGQIYVTVSTSAGLPPVSLYYTTDGGSAWYDAGPGSGDGSVLHNGLAVVSVPGSSVVLLYESA